MLDLANLFLQSGDLDSCQQFCMQALRVSPDGNDQASMVRTHTRARANKTFEEFETYSYLAE